MLRPLWARFGITGLLVTPLALALPVLAGDAVENLVALACVGAVGAGLRLHRPARPAPWVLIGLAMLLWAVGDLAYTVQEALTPDAGFPSPADVLYVAGYPAMVAAVALVVRRGGTRDAVAWQDAALWTLGVLLLAWERVLEPILSTPDSTVLARAVAFGFPLLDLLVLLLLLRMVGGRARPPAVYRALAAVIVCYLVTDVVYAAQAVTGSYDAGSGLDAGWSLAYVGIGTIALHPRMTELTEPARVGVRRSSRFRLLGLALMALTAPAVLAVQDLTTDRDDLMLVLAAASSMFALTMLRGAGLVRELEALTAELGRQGQELHRRATCDGLTGLANRSVLLDRLEHDLGLGQQVNVALLDLDDFKHVNDARGHEAGDTLLLQVGARLLSALRPEDLVARLGGDEFAVVSGTPVDDLAARLLACLERPVTADGSEVVVTASVGVAAANGLAVTPSELLRNADIAMYAAKGAGGGRAAVHRPEMSTDLLALLALRRQLAAGVTGEQFAAWLQPVADLATGRLVGFEALARWHPARERAVPPGEWMPVAEDTGLVVAIDAQVLRLAARQLMAWSSTVPGAAGLYLAVNASGRTLRESDVAERVLAVLHDEGLDPSRLVLEVTEGVLIEEAVGPKLQRLREAGVRIALDDFGTGWSSLSYLRRFPVDVLKIDCSFTAGILDGEDGEAVPAAVLQLAATLRLDVVAEGVETSEQAQALLRLGCRTAQGYLLGRPAPAEQLEGLVRRGRVDPPVVLLPA